MLLVHIHRSRRVIGCHLLMVMIGIVHQVGDGNRDGNVAIVMMLRMDQVVMVRMYQMIQRIASDRMRRNGTAGIVVTVALVIAVSIWTK